MGIERKESFVITRVVREDVIEGGTCARLQKWIEFGAKNKKVVDLSSEENHTNSKEDESCPC